jgi:hypothetical protein
MPKGHPDPPIRVARKARKLIVRKDRRRRRRNKRRLRLQRRRLSLDLVGFW